jgi:hypothetical protein
VAVERDKVEEWEEAAAEAVGWADQSPRVQAVIACVRSADTKSRIRSQFPVCKSSVRSVEPLW